MSVVSGQKQKKLKEKETVQLVDNDITRCLLFDLVFGLKEESIWSWSEAEMWLKDATM